MKWFLLWIALAVITSFIAGMKGRGGMIWTILSLLLGPLALIAILCLPEDKAQIEKEALADGKKCPFCAEVVKLEAIKCKHCGSDISKQQA